MKQVIKIFKLLPIFTGLIFLSACSNKEKNHHSYARPVYVSKAIEQTVPVYIKSFGYLTAERSVDIKSQVTGKILRCYFKQGQNIKKGQILFKINPEIYQAQLAESEADLKQDLADSEYQKYIVDNDNNLQRHGAISSQSYANLLTGLKKTKAKIQYAKARIDNAKINLKYCNIKSPINGIAGVRKVDPGNIVTANNGPTLVNIKKVNPLYLDFTVPEKNFSRLQQSMKKRTLKVLVFVDEFGIKKQTNGKMYTGSLEFFDNSIDHETGTIFLRAIIPNSKRELWPGEFFRLHLVLAEIKNALLVPYESVNQGLKGNYLFLVNKDNRAKLEYVKVGQKEGDYVVVYNRNIKPGDQVVTVGQMGLASGEKTRIVKKVNFKTPDFKTIDTAGYSKVIKTKEAINKSSFINRSVVKNKNIPRNQSTENNLNK